MSEGAPYAPVPLHGARPLAPLTRVHGWYDPACCSERDCKPLTRESTVTPVRGGYSIVLEPGGAAVFFPQEKVRPSQDGDYHACISPSSGAAFCLYVPAGA